MKSLGEIRGILGTSTIIVGALIYSGVPDYLKLTEVSDISPFFYGILFIAIIASWRCSWAKPFLSGRSGIKQIILYGWLALFIFLGGISVVYVDANFYSLQDLSRRISSAIFFGCLVFFTSPHENISAGQKSACYLVNHLIWAIVIGGVLLAGSVLLGVYQIAFITTGSCRAGGFYMNANGAAYTLALAIWFGSRTIGATTWRALFQAFLIFSLLLTMSRSGCIVAAIVFALLGAARKIDMGMFLKAFGMILALGSSVAWFQGEFSEGSCLWNGATDRAVIVEASSDNEPSWRVIPDAGSAERLKLGMEAVNKFRGNVFFGSGIDADKGERSHNQLLAFISQHGLAGGGLFLGFWILIIWAGVPKSLAVVLFFIAMFDHSFFYNRYILISVVCGMGVATLQNHNSCWKVKNG